MPKQRIWSGSIYELTGDIRKQLTNEPEISGIEYREYGLGEENGWPFHELGKAM